MQLEQTNATDPSCIQHFPVLLSQERLNFKRELSLQCPQDAPKFFTILLLCRIIPGKMDIYTTTSQLWRDRAEPPHLVRAHKHMADSSAVFQVFQMIKLVGKRPPA